LTILTSHLPISRWHEQIVDRTLAETILNRLLHNAHLGEMQGDSMRKNRRKPRTSKLCASRKRAVDQNSKKDQANARPAG
jgi:hypothetical protein